MSIETQMRISQNFLLLKANKKYLKFLSKYEGLCVCVCARVCFVICFVFFFSLSIPIH